MADIESPQDDAAPVQMSFLSLPVELRQSILELYFKDMNVVVMPQCKGRPYAHPKCDNRIPLGFSHKPHPCGAIFLVCKRLYPEAKAEFFRFATFDLSWFLEYHQCTSIDTFVPMQRFSGTTDILHCFDMPGFPHKHPCIRFNSDQKIRSLHIILGESFWRKGEKACLSAMSVLKEFIHAEHDFQLVIEIVLPRWKSANPSMGVTIDAKTHKKTYWPETNAELVNRWPWRMFLQRLDLAPSQRIVEAQ